MIVRRFVTDKTAILKLEDGEGEEPRVMNSFAVKPSETTVFGDLSIDEDGVPTVVGGTSSSNSYNPSGW